jgi:hypothetical protein
VVKQVVAEILQDMASSLEMAAVEVGSQAARHHRMMMAVLVVPTGLDREDIVPAQAAVYSHLVLYYKGMAPAVPIEIARMVPAVEAADS